MYMYKWYTRLGLLFWLIINLTWGYCIYFWNHFRQSVPKMFNAKCFFKHSSVFIRHLKNYKVRRVEKQRTIIGHWVTEAGKSAMINDHNNQSYYQDISESLEEEGGPHLFVDLTKTLYIYIHCCHNYTRILF